MRGDVQMLGDITLTGDVNLQGSIHVDDTIKIKSQLNKRQFQAFQMLFVQNKSEEEVARFLGFKTNERKRSAKLFSPSFSYQAQPTFYYCLVY